MHERVGSHARVGRSVVAAVLAGLVAVVGLGLLVAPAGAVAPPSFTVEFRVGSSAPASVPAGTSGSVLVTPVPTPYVGQVDVTTVDAQGNETTLGQLTFGPADTSLSIDNVVVTMAGTQTFTATDHNIPTTTGTTSVSVTAKPATHLGVSLGGTSVPAGVQGVHVTALDEYGNTDKTYGGTVALSSSDARAVLSGAYTFTTGDNGAHTFVATLPTAGAQTVTATDTHAASITGTAAVTVTPAATSRLAVTGTPSPLAIGTPADVTVTATDQFGNVTPAYAGQVSFSATDAASRVPAPYTFVAGDNGSHLFSKALMFGNTGSVTVTATDGTVSGSETITLVSSTTSGAGTPTVPMGYSLVGADGSVYHFGTPDEGSMAGRPLNAPIIGMAMTPSGDGYWLVAKDGGIFTFGDAQFLGSMGGEHLNQPVLGMEATPSGNGYWLFAADGGIFSYGDAAFYGSTGAMKLNSPVVGMAAMDDGAGYWLIASDGGIFAFNAPFAGSMGGQTLNQPIFDMAATPDGTGYWLVAKDGGIFTFGNADWYGSAVGKAIATVVGLAATPDGLGYWVADARGEVFAFGDGKFLGDVRFRTLPAPIVGFAALR